VTLDVFAHEKADRVEADALSHHFVILRTERAMMLHQRRDGRELRSLSIPGQLELTPAGSEADWEWSDPQGSIHLHLAPELLRQFVASSGGDASRFDLRSAFSFHDPLLRQLIRSLQLETQTSQAGPLYAEALAFALAAHLASHYSAHTLRLPTAPRRLSDRQLRLVLETVDARLHETIRVEELARTAGVSPFHFSRLYKASTGESPHQAVTRLRVEQAHRLLMRGKALAEIAAAVGFSDQSHLARHYKRVFGRSPAQARRNLI
jgi:AraC family transcriptional regulator